MACASCGSEGRSQAQALERAGIDPRQVDCVVVATVSHFLQTPALATAVAPELGTEQAADLLRRVDVACIGPVTADVATRLGIKTTIMPSDYTVPAMVRAIVDHVGEERRRAEK